MAAEPMMSQISLKVSLDQTCFQIVTHNHPGDKVCAQVGSVLGGWLSRGKGLITTFQLSPDHKTTKSYRTGGIKPDSNIKMNVLNDINTGWPSNGVHCISPINWKHSISCWMFLQCFIHNIYAVAV